MKHLTTVLGVVAAFGFLFNGTAQTVQYVTLTVPNPNGRINLPVETNQVISVVGYDIGFQQLYSPLVQGILPDGTTNNLTPLLYGSSSSGGGLFVPQVVTGLTNIAVQSRNPNYPPYGWATFQITTPSAVNVISNYVPADAVVIPASATGNVQIMLESSADLVNWTAASPGIYGPSSATNRFFRVRAVLN